MYTSPLLWRCMPGIYLRNMYMRRKREEKDMLELEKELFQLQDLDYRDFHSKLMPGIDKNNIIGIRIPV